MVKFLKNHRALLLLSSAWMIGTGFRFIMMKENDMYIFSWFDKLVDWGILFACGVLLLVLVVYDFLKEDTHA
jgi:hypothetical protein